MLIDTYGRVATDLRVSLTDRCNLRCTYCMPEEGLQWLGKPDLLTDDEIIRLLRIAVTRLGITEIRFTGGEPLLRPGLVGIVERTAALTPRPRISLTTNGIGLARTAEALKSAGLDRINVSLDTLRPDVFKNLTRRGRHHDVLAGLAAARAAGLNPVKVNSVLMPELNDDEAPDLLTWAMAEGYELRFIEQMPLDAQHGWRREGMVTAGDILRSLLTRFALTPEPSGERGAAPAERWLVDGGPYRVGIIASVTRPFCAACDRTRLTADGQIRTCLFATEETDLRAALRARPTDAGERVARSEGGEGASAAGAAATCDEIGASGASRASGGPDAAGGTDAYGEPDASGGQDPSEVPHPDSDEEIARMWRLAMWGKKAGSGLDDPTFLQPERPMSAIGG